MQNCLLAWQSFATSNSDLHAYAAHVLVTVACFGHYGPASSMFADYTNAALQTRSH